MTTYIPFPNDDYFNNLPLASFFYDEHPRKPFYSMNILEYESFYRLITPDKIKNMTNNQKMKALRKTLTIIDTTAYRKDFSKHRAYLVWVEEMVNSFFKIITKTDDYEYTHYQEGYKEHYDWLCDISGTYKHKPYHKKNSYINNIFIDWMGKNRLRDATTDYRFAHCLKIFRRIIIKFIDLIKKEMKTNLDLKILAFQKPSDLPALPAQIISKIFSYV